MGILIVAAAMFLLLWFLRQKYRNLWYKNIKIDLEFQKDKANVGEQLNLTETVENNKKISLPYIHVKFKLRRGLKFIDNSEGESVSDYIYRDEIFSLLKYQKVKTEVPFLCAGRGYYCIDRFELVSSGIFFDEEIGVAGKCHTQLLVYPKMADISRLRLAYSAIMGEKQVEKRLIEDPFIFRGIRDYQPFDALNTVNWKASARTGTLQVNVHESTTSERVMILLDLKSDDGTVYRELVEESISIAYTLLVEFEKSNSEIGLLTNASGDFYMMPGKTYGHYHEMEKCLALIDETKPMTEFAGLFKRFLEERPKDTTIILISQSSSSQIISLYQSISFTGGEYMWIMPVKAGSGMHALQSNMRNIIIWEVAYYGIEI